MRSECTDRSEPWELEGIFILFVYRSFSNFLSTEVSRLQSIQKGERFSRRCIISVVPGHQRMPPSGRRLDSWAKWKVPRWFKFREECVRQSQKQCKDDGYGGRGFKSSHRWRNNPQLLSANEIPSAVLTFTTWVDALRVGEKIGLSTALLRQLP
jgi:hypothetical protein